MKLVVLNILLLGHLVASDRTFTFRNKCSFTIWPGAFGNPSPSTTGWEMKPGTSYQLTVPDSFVAARFWARTGCRDVNGRFQCESGDCGNPQNNYGVQCGRITGTAVSVAEFTLQNGQPDFYDLSNVDGYDLPLQIIAHGQRVNNDGLGKFNCGNPSCRLDTNACPDELKKRLSSGQTMCLSICQAVHDNDQRSNHRVLQDIWDRGQTDLVCCSCACGPDCGCENPNCKYGCSPYNLPTPTERGGKCRVENWPTPASGRFSQYDRVFKDQCEDAYSWQFDDHKSTFQCMNANYEVVWCP